MSLFVEKMFTVWKYSPYKVLSPNVIVCATMICFPCVEGRDKADRWRAATIGVGGCSETNSLLSGMPPYSFFGVSSRLVSCSSELFCMRVLCDADGKEDSTS